MKEGIHQRLLLAVVTAVLFTCAYFSAGHPKGTIAAPLTLFFAVAAAFLLVRSLLNRTQVSFDEGRLRIVDGPLPPRIRLEQEIADIEGFVAVPSEDARRDGPRLFLVTKSGARIKLPITLDGAMWSTSGSFGAAFDRGAWLAATLSSMLDDARRRGGMYRIAPGLSPSEERDDEAVREAGREDAAKRMK